TWPSTISKGGNELRQKNRVDGHRSASAGRQKLAAKWPATWPSTISKGGNELRQKNRVGGHQSAAAEGDKVGGQVTAQVVFHQTPRSHFCGSGFFSVTSTVIVCSCLKSTTFIMPPMSIFSLPSSLSGIDARTTRPLTGSNRISPGNVILVRRAPARFLGNVYEPWTSTLIRSSVAFFPS